MCPRLSFASWISSGPASTGPGFGAVGGHGGATAGKGYRDSLQCWNQASRSAASWEGWVRGGSGWGRYVVAQQRFESRLKLAPEWDASAAVLARGS